MGSEGKVNTTRIHNYKALSGLLFFMRHSVPSRWRAGGPWPALWGAQMLCTVVWDGPPASCGLLSHASSTPYECHRKGARLPLGACIATPFHPRGSSSQGPALSASALALALALRTESAWCTDILLRRAHPMPAGVDEVPGRTLPRCRRDRHDESTVCLQDHADPGWPPDQIGWLMLDSVDSSRFVRSRNDQTMSSIFTRMQGNHVQTLPKPEPGTDPQGIRKHPSALQPPRCVGQRGPGGPSASATLTLPAGHMRHPETLQT